MNIVPSNSTVANYCHAMDRGEIRVNREYQRSEKVWPDAARSYLIETILLGFPLPKLYLHQITDLRSRQTVQEIVDGQQRSMTILDYFHNRFALSRTIDTAEAAGLTYDELPDDLKGAFVDYSLSYDLFTGATAGDVREVFQRINSYTFPLNPEEERHALFQGPFKWFINRLSRSYAESFFALGVFTRNQLVRMGDTKLLTEVSHAWLNGITTTNKTTLKALYKSRNRDFPEEQAMQSSLEAALDQLIAWPRIHRTRVMKPNQLYALLLAVAHVHHPIEQLEAIFQSPALAHFDDEVAVANLLALAEALADPEAALADPNSIDGIENFLDASAAGTNVGAKRVTRFQWYCRALTDGF